MLQHRDGDKETARGTMLQHRLQGLSDGRFTPQLGLTDQEIGAIAFARHLGFPALPWG